jgi:glycine/D-amino acid oxidase-like deaminating enzyme
MPTAHGRSAPGASGAPGRSYGPPSFWFAQDGPAPRRPALDRDRAADVCIIGAGYTGLWTAYELRRADPQLEVVVLESQFAGFGASGRNGGWVLGELAGPPERWIARSGREATRAMTLAIQETVDEVGAVIAREQIECDFVKGGTLTLARSQLQLSRLRQDLQGDREHALGREGAVLLEGDGARELIAIEGLKGAVFSPHCARVQPARLVRGLASAAERAGATLYEDTDVAGLSPGAVTTATGHTVRARYVIRATEGYTTRLPGLRRALLPLNSSMIITEPIDEEIWATLGWQGMQTVHDSAHLYVYLQRTADGRVAIGGRGVPYRYGSRTDREGPVSSRTVTELRGRLAALFPVLGQVGIEAAWHGVFGVARDWMPSVGLDRESGIAWAGGYVGEGVAAANLAGRTLRDLLLARDTPLTRLPWVRRPPRDWEPEPFRFIGARGIYGLYRRTGRPAALARMADIVAGR